MFPDPETLGSNVHWDEQWHAVANTHEYEKTVKISCFSCELLQGTFPTFRAPSFTSGWTSSFSSEPQNFSSVRKQRTQDRKSYGVSGAA